MHCEQCGNQNLITIHLDLSDEALALHRCAYCDIRVWEGHGGEVGLDHVLEMATRSEGQ